jgi:hypothetical protein
MSDLVERYVHQVGRYLPPKERAEIEAELRSQIQDQLDDRYAGSPSPEEVAAVLAEFGHPYKIAASYSSDQYLVGPAIYPYMMMVLRYGWLLVPAIFGFLHLFGTLVSAEPVVWFDLIVGTALAAIQATLIFSAVAILFFALIQHSVVKLGEEKPPFNPLELPEIDDPRAVDLYEAVAGIAIGTFFVLALLYFVVVGGLTLNFNLSNPGEVIPAPTGWLILLIFTVAAEVTMMLIVLRRNQWGIGSWLIETVLEVFGMVCLYFAIFVPLFQRAILDDPGLVSRPIISSAPELIVIGMALITLLGRGARLVRLWGYQNNPPPLTVQASE